MISNFKRYRLSHNEKAAVFYLNMLIEDESSDSFSLLNSPEHSFWYNGKLCDSKTSSMTMTIIEAFQT